jgi:cytochrome c nitrite reductase small subunit
MLVARVLLITAAALVGATLGLGGYVFVYAKGASYLTNDPAACANCHVMQTQFDAWRKSSHHAVAVCNDCHAPVGAVAKYVVKARNGYNHASAFTTGNFPDVIRITAANMKVSEEKCRHCHAAITAAIAGPHTDPTASCVRCHASVGHFTRN